MRSPSKTYLDFEDDDSSLECLSPIQSRDCSLVTCATTIDSNSIGDTGECVGVGARNLDSSSSSAAKEEGKGGRWWFSDNGQDDDYGYGDSKQSYMYNAGGNEKKEGYNGSKNNDKDEKEDDNEHSNSYLRRTKMSDQQGEEPQGRSDSFPPHCKKRKILNGSNEAEEDGRKKQRVIATQPPEVITLCTMEGKEIEEETKVKEVNMPEPKDSTNTTAKGPTSTAPTSAYNKRMDSIVVGRRGDPRMNKAVAVRLERPGISGFEALVIGGFKFPAHINEESIKGYSAKSVFDSDNISLKQRKNQLSRRIRKLGQKQREQKLIQQSWLEQRRLEQRRLVQTAYNHELPSSSQEQKRHQYSREEQNFRAVNKNSKMTANPNATNSPSFMNPRIGNSISITTVIQPLPPPFSRANPHQGNIFQQRQLVPQYQHIQLIQTVPNQCYSIPEQEQKLTMYRAAAQNLRFLHNSSQGSVPNGRSHAKNDSIPQPAGDSSSSKFFSNQ